MNWTYLDILLNYYLLNDSNHFLTVILIQVFWQFDPQMKLPPDHQGWVVIWENKNHQWTLYVKLGQNPISSKDDIMILVVIHREYIQHSTYHYFNHNFGQGE